MYKYIGRDHASILAGIQSFALVNIFIRWTLISSRTTDPDSLFISLSCKNLTWGKKEKTNHIPVQRDEQI